VHVLVTGGAGFIGSHLAERLLEAGHAVTVVDRFAPAYDRRTKEANLGGIRSHRRARFFEADLAHDDFSAALDGVTAVAHVAAQAGIRASWGSTFAVYLDDNVLATQRLLEAVRGRALSAFVNASSASVYGDDHLVAVTEQADTRPHNPYGITKLAAEHLARLYHRLHDVPTLSLRYFSVYGPRERPDKAIQRFLVAARDGTPVQLLGDGTQARDFTFVGDIVTATVAALERPPIGETINLARGHTVSVSDVLATVERVTGRRLVVERKPEVKGDVRMTSAVIDRARRLLGYAPKVDLEAGIRAQWAHVQGQAP
jgi:UDP-glucose 4-epimerase